MPAAKVRSVAGKQEKPFEERGQTVGGIPQTLLVQGAVEAVNLLLAVFNESVHRGPTAYHLEHVAARCRGARGLASESRVRHHLYHPLPSSPANSHRSLAWPRLYLP